MLLLTIRTDKPEAELELYEDSQRLDSLHWEAHRQLAETIHRQMDALVENQHKTLQEIEGIVVFKGPGSFTGLRIGISVANALADSLKIPIVGTRATDWQQAGIVDLLADTNHQQVQPDYGAEARTTQPRK